MKHSVVYPRIFCLLLTLLSITGCLFKGSDLSFESLDKDLFGISIKRTHIVIPKIESTTVHKAFDKCPGENCEIRVFTEVSVNNAFNNDGEVVVGEIRLYKKNRLILSAISNENLDIISWRKPTRGMDLRKKVVANYQIIELDSQFFQGFIKNTKQSWMHIKSEPVWWIHEEQVRIEADYYLSPPGYEPGTSLLSFTPGHFPILTETEQRLYDPR